VTIWCVYHRIDFDGVCSAAITRHKYPGAELIGLDYYDKFDTSTFKDGDTVIVVDFSFPPEGMEELNNRCTLIWCDHHRTSIEKNSHLSIEGSQGEELAGCEHTIKYFFPDDPVPRAVTLLGRYDIWDHEDPDVVPFQLGMRVSDAYDPLDPIWYKLLVTATSPFIDSIIDDGHIIQAYEKEYNKRYMVSHAIECEFNGISAIAVNKGLISTYTFDGFYDPKRHILMVGFSFQPNGMWRYSLRTEKDYIDCGALARAFGGGGHPKSAGFEWPELLINTELVRLRQEMGLAAGR